MRSFQRAHSSRRCVTADSISSAGSGTMQSCSIPRRKNRPGGEDVPSCTTAPWTSRGLTPPDVRNTKSTKGSCMDWRPGPRPSSGWSALSSGIPTLLLDRPKPIDTWCPGILQDTIPAGVLLQGQQAVRGDHELPVHRLQEAGVPLQRIAYGNQYRKGRMQKDGNTIFHLILQVDDTQCLYAWTIYLRVRH